MTRKSLEFRKSQTEDLIAQYNEAGLTQDRSCSFLQDMLNKMQTSRNLSKGQRTYLDNLIEQGVPKLKNEDWVKEILSAASVDGMQHVARTLNDFAYKVGKGWSLSEKQEKFLNNLLVKAEDIRKNGKFIPSKEMIVDLENIAELSKTKNSWYWQHRPGTAKAYDKIEKWFTWRDEQQTREEISVLTGRTLETVDEPPIDQWACDKLLNTFKKQIEELHKPKHQEGTMRWSLVETNTQRNSTYRFVLVTGMPIVHSGEISYPCLIEGEITYISSDKLKKRRS